MSFFSSAGPATVRSPTPSSSRTICASVVLPRPGGPASRTWSSASARALAASRAIRSCSLTRSWPTKSSSRRGRSERSTSSSSGRSAGARNWLTPPPRAGRAGRAPRRQLGIDLGERPLGVDDGVAELDERVARDEVAGRVGRRRRATVSSTVAELLLQLEHDPLRGLLADPRDRLEARVVAERDRPAQLGRRRAGDDGERDLRADAADREQMDEQLALLGVGEAVELQRVLADVQVRLDRHLRPGRGAPQDGWRRRDEVPDAVDVEHEPLGAADPRAGRGAARSRAGPHDAIRASGGISAWQIATARASAACEVGGSSSSESSIFTIRDTWPLSARP